jgi:hypothetical protein
MNISTMEFCHCNDVLMAREFGGKCLVKSHECFCAVGSQSICKALEHDCVCFDRDNGGFPGVIKCRATKHSCACFISNVYCRVQSGHQCICLYYPEYCRASTHECCCHNSISKFHITPELCKGTQHYCSCAHIHELMRCKGSHHSCLCLTHPDLKCGAQNHHCTCVCNPNHTCLAIHPAQRTGRWGRAQHNQIGSNRSHK